MGVVNDLHRAREAYADASGSGVPDPPRRWRRRAGLALRQIRAH